jgi:hypothetical protein
MRNQPVKNFQTDLAHDIARLSRAPANTTFFWGVRALGTDMYDNPGNAVWRDQHHKRHNTSEPPMSWFAVRVGPDLEYSCTPVTIESMKAGCIPGGVEPSPAGTKV